MRKVQVYLTERQYRVLKQRAGQGGSIAGAVRDLVDGAGGNDDFDRDSFYRRLAGAGKGSGAAYDAGEAKRALQSRKT